MDVVDVHNRIRSLAEERGLTTYKLAEISGLPRSSIYNMFERGTMPKIDTLDKICKGLEISLSDFFLFQAVPNVGGYLAEGEKELLMVHRNLMGRNQDRLIIYARGLEQAQNDKE